MKEMQDLTPQERVDDALLARILGRDCDCDRSRQQARYEVSAISARAEAVRPVPTSGCGTCGCARDEGKTVCGFGVQDAVLASVYPPMQRFCGVYDMDTALRRGTMFEPLDKPFYGDGREVDCRGK